MDKSYCMHDGKRNRIRFRIKTPKALWDCLPKFITRELASDTPATELRCQACGRRLRDLFGRAVQGMVARTILHELVNEICNEELCRNTPRPEIVENPAANPNAGRSFTGSFCANSRSLNINIYLYL